MRSDALIGMYLKVREADELFNRLNWVENYIENHFYRANGGCEKIVKCLLKMKQREK